MSITGALRPSDGTCLNILYSCINVQTKMGTSVRPQSMIAFYSVNNPISAWMPSKFSAGALLESYDKVDAIINFIASFNYNWKSNYIFKKL